MKKIISMILTAAMLSGGVVTVQASDKYYFADNFNSYDLNTRPETIELSGSEHSRIKEDGKQNKAVYMPYSDYDAELCIPFTREKDTFTFAMDLKKSDKALNMRVKLCDTASDTKTEFVNIANNMIVLSNGKRLGAISGSKYQELAVSVNVSDKLYNIYLDGRCLASDIEYSAVLPSSLKLDLLKTGGDLQPELYIDNIFVYEGGYTDNSSRKSGGYGGSGYDYLEIDNSSGDHSFFNNKFINDYTNDYRDSQPYMSFVSNPKTNKIVYDRSDRFNPNRTSDAIHLYRTTTDDCFFDIYPKKKYPYMLLRADFRIDNFGGPVDLFHIRDNITTSTVQNDYSAQVNAGGILSVLGKNVKQLKSGETFNVAICFNMQTNTANAYLNGELIVKDGAFNSEIKEIRMVRTNLNFGGSPPNDLHCDNYEVIGMHREYAPDDSNKSSVFPSDDVYKSYLADKTAFNSNSRVVWANGEKHTMEKSFKYENNEMFVPSAALNTAFGLTLEDSADGKRISGGNTEFKADSNEVNYLGTKYTMSAAAIFADGSVYVPIKAFAKEVLKKYVKDDEMGMVLISDNPINLDFENELPEYRRADTGWSAVINTAESPIKGLNYFLTYQRPSAEELREKFYDEQGNAPSHPRILITQKDIDELKKDRYTDEKLKKRIDALIALADDKLDKDVPIYSIPDTFRLLDQSRRTLTFTENLGLAYLLTGDKKYAQKCWEVLKAVCTFPDWNTSHVIDAGEMLPAVAMGYDWIYDTLDDDQRKLVENAICKFGLEPFQLGYYGRLTGGRMSQSWLFPKWKSNFNTVVNGGVALGALAIAETNPDLCFDVLSNATRSIEYTLRGFAPEGAWIESISYWQMTMQNVSQFTLAMNSIYGEDFGVMDGAGIKDSWKYPYFLTGNTGVNNLHDMNSSQDYNYTLELLTYAKLYNNPYVFELRDKLLDEGKVDISARDILRYVPEMQQADYSKLDLDYKVEGLEAFSARSSWTDKNGMFLSAHAGPVNYYHSQVDVGTFVLDMNGERWADELGVENYAYINHGGYGFKEIYRRRAESHNVVVINPSEEIGQNWDGFGKMTRFESKPKGALCEYDLTDVYKGQVNGYKRGFMLTNDRTTAVIKDEINLSERADTIYWFMSTKADISIDDKKSSATLVNNGKVMKLYFESSDPNAEIEVMSAEPLSTSPNPEGQTRNDEYKRIAIKLSGDKDENVTIAVRFAENDVMNRPDYMKKDIADWSIPDGELSSRKEDMKLDYVVIDGEKLNTFETIRYYGDENRPQLTQAASKNPDCRTAFEYFKNESMEGYRINVYAPDESYYTQYIIPLIKRELPADVLGYKRYPIINVYTDYEPESWNNRWNILDEDLSTRWTTYTIGAYGVADLGEVKAVDAVALSFWKGSERTYKYELYCSEDGENYTKMADIVTSGKTEDYELNEFGTYNARYIKFVNKGNSANDNSNITEFAVLKRNCDSCGNQ